VGEIAHEESVDLVLCFLFTWDLIIALDDNECSDLQLVIVISDKTIRINILLLV
jgi:hypothetical protein